MYFLHSMEVIQNIINTADLYPLICARLSAAAIYFLHYTHINLTLMHPMAELNNAEFWDGFFFFSFPLVP